MDYQRIIIILGLAVTAYLLVLEWNKDYGQNGSPAETEQMVPGAADPVTLDVVPEVPVPVVDDIPEGVVPTLDPEEPIDIPVSIEAETDRFILVETDVLKLTIDTVGGDIVSLSLPRYPISLDEPDQPYVLVDPKNSYSAQSGLIGPDGTDTAAGRPRFITTSLEYTLGDADEMVVELTLPGSESGLTVHKQFRFRRSDYLIDISYQVANQTQRDWSAAIYAQIKRDSQKPHEGDSNMMGMQPYIGGATWTSDVPYQKLEFEDLAEQPYRAKSPNGYVAMVQKYFVTALVPDREGTYTYQARKLPGQDVFLLGYTAPLWTVAAGANDARGIQYYAGPKDQSRLLGIAEGLDLTIDYGFLWWLAQPLFFLLTMIQGFVVNWGVAIILLTCIIKTVLYPLSAASFRSNAKLRKLQPQMARLKEQHGEDKQKFSQAMMDLYKKEGANPLGGCLPLLLQMPVFIALYWVLLESVELRQAPFVLWIHDLSALDPYFVLPILYGIVTYFSMALQPAPPDPMQAKVFKMMPIMFTFFFLWFPSGLVLYWLVNGVLQILQQLYVTRQIEAQE